MEDSRLPIGSGTRGALAPGAHHITAIHNTTRSLMHEGKAPAFGWLLALAWALDCRLHPRAAALHP